MDPIDNLLGQVLAFVLAFIIFLIPLALIILANLGEKYQAARVLTIAAGVLLCLLLLACGPLVAITGFTSSNGSAAPPPLGVPPLVSLLMGVVMLGTGLVAMLPFIPQVRQVLAYVLPRHFRPGSVVHALTLSLTLLIIGFSVAQLPLAVTLANPTEEQRQSLQMFNSMATLWLQGLMFVLYGFFGVGWGIRRGWRETLQRLGLTRLTPAGLSIAIAAWLGLLLMDIFVSLIWRTISPGSYQEFGKLTDTLFGSFVSIPGALTIGLSAGIGEEILFRGALQPVLGIPLTAFLFMIVHAQYGFTPALLQILVVGVVLGLIRRYANTTACIVVHTLFNTTSVLLALFFPDWI